MPLEPNDLQHLNAAIGYCELDMFQEANDELEEINAFCWGLPEMLSVRLEIYRNLQKWDLMEVVAKRLMMGNRHSQ